MKSKRRMIHMILYILAMLLFVVYLVSANRIVASFSRDNRVEVIDFAGLDSGSEVFYVMDSEYLGGLMETEYVSGWAFCETDGDNSGKQINLILKSVSSDLCYRICSNAQYREDVYLAFRETRRIHNGNANMANRFSTVTIRSGEYEVWLEVIENETDRGMINTGRIAVKTGDTFEISE